MEKYVTSRKLSERLKAAGYPQNTQYYWRISDREPLLSTSKYDDRRNESFAAPMSDELLDELHGKLILTTYSLKEADRTLVIEAKDFIGHSATVAEGRPAEALARVWLWRRQQGKI